MTINRLIYANREGVCRKMDNIDNMGNKDLIAPCGMNCSLCVSYQFGKYNLNKKGFHKKYCPGCIPRDMNCIYMANHCDLIGKGQIRFCTECQDFPCKYLKGLDKRYSTKYNMSMIENLKYISSHGIDEFLAKEEEKWKCEECGNLKCCHDGLCLTCKIDILAANKKYRE